MKDKLLDVKYNLQTNEDIHKYNETDHEIKKKNNMIGI